MNTIIKICLLGLFIITTQSCSDSPLVNEPVKSELSDSFLSTKTGINSLLVGAYSNLVSFNTNNSIGLNEWGTDIAWETGGGLEGTAKPIINFTWDPTLGFFNTVWEGYYTAIRDANMVLDNVDDADINDEDRKALKTEARFVRAIAYYRFWRFYGPVPLRKSTKGPLQIAKPREDEFLSFATSELKQVIPDLPEIGQQKQYGRAHKSAARAFLAKLYLNTKQWKKAANMAEQIINGGKFTLFPSYPDMFKIENEQNSEYVWVWQMTNPPNSGGNRWLAAAAPPGFAKDPNSEAAFKSTWQNWAAQFRMRDKFFNSFSPNDQRKELFITEYINQQGDKISLRGHDDVRSFKYWPDPNGINANRMGMDIPVIRYADILLSRAEALNELQGPNQNSINLVNMVRNRAGLDDIQLGDFGSKGDLRDHILKERGWEFYSEGKRRMDLIRMGKFISNAHKRGISTAKPYMVRYPIPQNALDANPKLEQNEGY